MTWQTWASMLALMLVPIAAAVASFGFGVWAPWLGIAAFVCEAIVIVAFVLPIFGALYSDI